MTAVGSNPGLRLASPLYATVYRDQPLRLHRKQYSRTHRGRPAAEQCSRTAQGMSALGRRGRDH